MNDFDVAIAVAGKVRQLCASRFGTTLQRLDKGAGDFATNADIEAENAMLALLHRERPEDAILGEESGRSGASSGVRTWLIDPLCGTLNYAARMRVVAVNVALRVEGGFIAAAVADPFNDEIFWTDGVVGLCARRRSGYASGPRWAFAARGPELRSALSQCTGVQSGNACGRCRIRRQLQASGGIDIGCAHLGRHWSAGGLYHGR